MRTILLWLTSLLITGFFISPFFLFWFVKKKSKKIYLVVSALASFLVYVWAWIKGYYLLSDYFAKVDADLYYFYYDASDFAMFYIFIPLMIVSPFIFTKILYTQFTLKRFFVSLFLSSLILMGLFLFFAYVLFPMAGSVLLNNI
ncbi:MAG: hypothetical protein PF572_06870 [Patescibacteria group bacterium]|jgi:hypothetical protein|nr:hypothetical protein [Patescibacteria group bacterium]